uniref:Uncharacterized protein n=1 Tax=Pundamilia nyererei TaxID=303518 RepID=A0A3B4ETG3_9CICH
MEILHVFLESIYSVVLLAALTVFLLFYLHSSNIFPTQKDGKEPPGPTPLPLIGNLLQLDLKRIYLSKKYGSIFTIYLGTKKVVFLLGYNTVKEALVDYAEAFGERDPIPIMDELFRGQDSERNLQHHEELCKDIFNLQCCIHLIRVIQTCI